MELNFLIKKHRFVKSESGCPRRFPLRTISAMLPPTPNFLLLSDVFCPWCYGFGRVMRRLVAEHPGWPVLVLCGGLMDEPSTLADSAEESPHIRDFFVRLADTTGQSVGQAFLDKLDPARGRLIRLYSPAVAAPLAALKRLDPGRALEHMEAFQAAFYGGGQDVLNPDVQRELAVGLGADPAAFSAALAAPDLPERVQAEMDEAAAIMGEFALYPTLYLEDGASRRLLARGFAPYEQVAAKLADAASAPVLGPSAPSTGIAIRAFRHGNALRSRARRGFRFSFSLSAIRRLLFHQNFLCGLKLPPSRGKERSTRRRSR